MITLRELGAIGSGTDLSADYVDARRALGWRDRWRASARAWRGEAAWDEASARWAIVWVRHTKRVPLISGAALLTLGALIVLGFAAGAVAVAGDSPLSAAFFVGMSALIAFSIGRSLGVQRRGGEAVARNAELLGGEVPLERPSQRPTRVVRLLALAYLLTVFLIVGTVLGALVDLHDSALGIALRAVIFSVALAWSAGRRRKRRDAERRDAANTPLVSDTPATHL